MQNMSTKIYDFLNKEFRSNEAFTHLSFEGGKWTIPDNRLDDFYKLYFEQYEKENVHLIEKLNKDDVFKLFWDLEIPKGQETYSFNTQTDNFKILLKTILKVMNNSFKDPNLEYIITERTITKDISKIHINFPNILVNANVAKSIINKIKEDLQQTNRLDLIVLIDSTVYNTGLRMFGSKKSKAEILKEMQYLDKKQLYDKQYYSKKYRLQNHQVIDECLLYKTLIKPLPTQKKTLSALQDSFKQTVKENIKLSKKNQVNIKDDVKADTQADIAALLSELQELPQFKQYNLEINRVNCAEHENFLNYYVQCVNDICPFKNRKHTRPQNPVYVQINRRGVFIKCYDSECTRLRYPNSKTEQIVLEDFLPEDSELLKTLKVNYVDMGIKVSKECRQVLEESIKKQSHFSIAKTAQYIFGNRFRVDNLKNTEWYQFDGTRFNKSEILDEILSDEFVNYYESMKICDTSRISDILEYIKGESNKAQEYNKTIDKIIAKLEDVTFKNKVKNQLGVIAFNKDPKFYNRLNQDPYTIGFNDGVYDLKTFEFRQGKQSDYITFNTNNDYIEYDPENECIKEIMIFLEKIIADPKVREYLLYTLARSLEGIPDEKFYIWTGSSGANGKSTLISLLQNAMGDYQYAPDVSMLTEKRKGNGNASPDLFMIKGKRLLTYQEPDNNAKLQTGTIKQYTGDDDIVSRELFKAPISFKSQGTIVLITNELPIVNALDGGIWRRIRVIKFISQFVDNPNPNNKNEHSVDAEIKDKVKIWGKYFMTILIHYYKKYVKNGRKIYEPEPVLEATKKYKANEDIYDVFIKSKLEKADNENIFITCSDLYSQFVEHWRDTHPETKWVPRDKFFFGAITRVFNVEQELNKDLGQKVYYNLQFQNKK